MNAPMQRPGGPPCHRCEQPMVWHSQQAVRDSHGERTMQVFRCETCNQLQAVAPSDKAA